MAEFRHTKVEQGQPKIRNVPIAVTPDGFWCCPYPVVFQKNHLKPQNPLNDKPKTSSPPHKTSVHKKQTSLTEKKPPPTFVRSAINSDQQDDCAGSETPGVNVPPVATAERVSRSKVENLPRKVAIEFGESGTSDLKVVLIGKQGFCVKLSVHREVLIENSSFFANKLLDRQCGSSSCLEIEDCEDVEIYVETVGLMYCKEMKQRLIKQSVTRVLRILKVAQLFGFNSCIQSCLEYLEAVPWVGEEEEEKVVSSVLRLQGDGIGVDPAVLKRISPVVSIPPKDTITHIMELVLKSNDERSRREMKSVVLKLLKEKSSLPHQAGSADICIEAIYNSCRSCVDSLLYLLRQASEPDFKDKPIKTKDPVSKQIALESDNLSWLLEILSDRHAAEEFAVMWANQQELATLHLNLPIVVRYHISSISSRLFVCIGRGDLLPSKETRQMMLHTWLQPLINDYGWLQHSCRSFDRKVVEDGIGRTILTLPLEDQQRILLDWLGSFLKAGDSCPNLQPAFEVWWRRTFIRPFVEPQIS